MRLSSDSKKENKGQSGFRAEKKARVWRNTSGRWVGILGAMIGGAERIRRL
jgi:hypothetical protein